jgi:hypothetical protein
MKYLGSIWSVKEVDNGGGGGLQLWDQCHFDHYIAGIVDDWDGNNFVVVTET